MVFCCTNLNLKTMKTQKITLGFLFLLTLVFFSSCTKYDRPAELSVDAQSLEFDNYTLNRKFNIVNMGDELLSVAAYSDEEWVTVIGGDVRLSHAQSTIVSIQINPEFFEEYGVYSANLFLQSNGGNYTIPISVYYYQSEEPQLAVDLDYLKFTSNTTQNYFTIYNDGVGDMNFLLDTDASWVQFSQNIGTIAQDEEQRIYVDVDRAGLDAGIYSTEINIISNGGNTIIDLDMDVAVYSITFFNPVFTTIEILSPEFDPVQIEAGEHYSFLFTDNPASFVYTASTQGVTDSGTPLGINILWDEEIDVSGYDSPTFNLNISADYFFLAVKNTGNYYLDLWSINYGNDFQIDDDFSIPNDAMEYGVAYYDAFEDTDIYARLSGTAYDVKWSQGVEFVFPWTENQSVLLENNFKKSTLIRDNLKSSSTKSLMVKPFKRSVTKPKGSIDLYNKR